MTNPEIISFLQEVQTALDVECCCSSMDADHWSYRIDEVLTELEESTQVQSKSKKTNISNSKSEVGTSGPCKGTNCNCSSKTK